jgi:hypothetical protein
MAHTNAVVTEEHIHGDTRWVAIRARGAEWSWLTIQEALILARQWQEEYAPTERYTT